MFERQQQPGRLLRIVCLHGYGQSAHRFRSRNAGLARQLKHIAELVAVDAPYQLPFLVKGTPGAASAHSSPESSSEEAVDKHLHGMHTAAETSTESVRAEPADEDCSDGMQTAAELLLEELAGVSAAAMPTDQRGSCAQQRGPTARRGWLLEPGQLAALKVGIPLMVIV